MPAVAALVVCNLGTAHTGWHPHHIDKATIKTRLLSINDRIRTRDITPPRKDRLPRVPTVVSRRMVSSYNSLRPLTMAENMCMLRLRDHHQLRIKATQQGMARACILSDGELRRGKFDVHKDL